MNITGLHLGAFAGVTALISAEKYGGNIAIHPDSHEGPVQRNRATGRLTSHCTARLTVHDSHGPGSRTTWTGRHGPYACWHAYRDVLTEVFTRYPDAVIRAGHSWQVTYRGMTGFRELYPGTGNISIGSEACPVTMPELCECGDGVYDSVPLVTRDSALYHPDYVSPAVVRAAAAYQVIERLLEDTSSDPWNQGRKDKDDPWVFGPQDSKFGASW